MLVLGSVESFAARSAQAPTKAAGVATLNCGSAAPSPPPQAARAASESSASPTGRREVLRRKVMRCLQVDR